MLLRLLTRTLFYLTFLFLRYSPLKIDTNPQKKLWSAPVLPLAVVLNIGYDYGLQLSHLCLQDGCQLILITNLLSHCQLCFDFFAPNISGNEVILILIAGESQAQYFSQLNSSASLFICSLLIVNRNLNFSSRCTCNPSIDDSCLHPHLIFPFIRWALLCIECTSRRKSVLKTG